MTGNCPRNLTVRNLTVSGYRGREGRASRYYCRTGSLEQGSPSCLSKPPSAADESGLRRQLYPLPVLGRRREGMQDAFDRQAVLKTGKGLLLAGDGVEQMRHFDDFEVVEPQAVARRQAKQP